MALRLTNLTSSTYSPPYLYGRLKHGMLQVQTEFCILQILIYRHEVNLTRHSLAVNLRLFCTSRFPRVQQMFVGTGNVPYSVRATFNMYT